jgi:hypothetical protein
MRFKWIAWNRAHLARHGVSEREAESVIRDPDSVHRVRRDGSVVTTGRTAAGRLFVVWREADERGIFADLESAIFVITAYEP